MLPAARLELGLCKPEHGIIMSTCDSGEFSTQVGTRKTRAGRPRHPILVLTLEAVAAFALEGERFHDL